jgi:hypothetical protein
MRPIVALALFGLWLAPLYGAHAQQGAVAACKLPRIGGIPVTANGFNRVITNADADGNQVSLLIDTGSPTTVMNPRPDGQRHTGTRKGTFRVLEDISTISAYPAKIAKLTMGDYDFKDVTVAYAERLLITGDVYGVLGGDVLGSVDLEMDLSRGIINLFGPNKCGESAIYWSDKFSEAELATGRRQIDIIVELNGIRARALLDTGSAESWVSWELAGRAGVHSDSPGMMEDAQSRHPDLQAGKTMHYRFSELKVGDEVVKNANLGIKKFGWGAFWGAPVDNFYDVDMVLGVDFLRNHHLYVDRTAEKVYFTWNGKTIFTPPAIK